MLRKRIWLLAIPDPEREYGYRAQRLSLLYFFLSPRPPSPLSSPPLRYVLGISDQGVREPTTCFAQWPRGTSASYYYCIN